MKYNELKRKDSRERYEMYVKVTVDGLVSSTDFPVTAKVLEESGVADRTLLRKMERKGLLKSMRLSAGNGHMIAYYSEDMLPKYERERRAKINANNEREQPNTGEGGKDGYEEAVKLYEEIYGEPYDSEGEDEIEQARRQVTGASDRAVEVVHHKAQDFRSKADEEASAGRT